MVKWLKNLFKINGYQYCQGIYTTNTIRCKQACIKCIIDRNLIEFKNKTK